ncbi:unnamed protein product, partial [Mesorhabditis spiculigera]
MQIYSDVDPYDVPEPFRACESIFRVKDFQYVECIPNITTHDTPCELLKELHRAKDFRKYFLAILPIIFSIIALILNASYLTIHFLVFRQEKYSYRKRALFLLSRAISSVTALILFYVVLIVWKSHGFIYSSVTIFIMVGSLEFLSITGTYVVLTLLLYTAITRPFIYKTQIRMRHCIAGVITIWTVSVAASICIGIWGATLFYPESAAVSCSFDYCQKPLAIVVLILLIFSYTTVLVLYFFLILRLKRRSSAAHLQRSASTGSQKSSLRALNRLGMNVGTFALGNVPIVIILLVAVINLEKLSSLGEGKKSHCKTYLNSKLFVEVEILASCAAIIWLFAMILDPVINVISDPKMLALLIRGFKYVRRRVLRRENEEKDDVKQAENSSQ